MIPVLLVAHASICWMPKALQSYLPAAFNALEGTPIELAWKAPGKHSKKISNCKLSALPQHWQHLCINTTALSRDIPAQQ